MKTENRIIIQFFVAWWVVPLLRIADFVAFYFAYSWGRRLAALAMRGLKIKVGEGDWHRIATDLLGDFPENIDSGT